MIGDNKLSGLIYNFREFVGGENKDNWLIPLKLDYNLETKIVNKKHPKFNQIIYLINRSLECGIKNRRDGLFKHGILLLFNLFKDPSSEKFQEITNEIYKKRINITFDQLESVFKWFLLISCSSFTSVISEFIIHKKEKSS